MKTLIVLINLISVLAFASSSSVKLTTLKPVTRSNLALGQLNVDLISSTDEKTIAKISGRLGDCIDCIRGVSIQGDLGIRIEGSSIESLKFIRKQTLKIKITSCPLDFHPQATKVLCEFSLSKNPMKLVFSIIR